MGEKKFVVEAIWDADNIVNVDYVWNIIDAIFYTRVVREGPDEKLAHIYRRSEIPDKSLEEQYVALVEIGYNPSYNPYNISSRGHGVKLNQRLMARFVNVDINNIGIILDVLSNIKSLVRNFMVFIHSDDGSAVAVSM